MFLQRVYLFDFHALGAYLPLSHRNIIKPPCEGLLFRFAKEASLKCMILTFSKFTKFGNFNKTSNHLSLRIYLLAVFK